MSFNVSFDSHTCFKHICFKCEVFVIFYWKYCNFIHFDQYFIQDTGRLLIGAVGAYDWTGTVLKYDNFNQEKADVADNDDIKQILVDRSIESYLG